LTAYHIGIPIPSVSPIDLYSLGH